MTLLTSFLGIVERALQDPSDKAAIQIALDGMTAWRAIANNPAIIKLEADIAAYTATIPKDQQPPPIGAPVQPQQPQVGGRPQGANRGGLMDPNA